MNRRDSGPKYRYCYLDKVYKVFQVPYWVTLLYLYILTDPGRSMSHSPSIIKEHRPYFVRITVDDDIRWSTLTFFHSVIYEIRKYLLCVVS